MDISDLNFKPCICGYQVIRIPFIVTYILNTGARFVVFVGTISRRTSISAVLLAVEYTLMKLLSSNPLICKSKHRVLSILAVIFNMP